MIFELISGEREREREPEEPGQHEIEREWEETEGG